jgi:diadenosine tetraphosphatase ApaH/serine/threonine PP2A family protein phosphatase
VLLGHSHRPDLVRLPGGVTILNPGSVGCPAYHDPTGRAHVSESGAPHARYAVVEVADGELRRADLRAVAYDWEAAARRAEANGRPDWGHALRTGLMPA